ncbi:hypothetical protein C8J57DRAFT_1463529 [Mycena rebaudengoi]|nr:hypothetical protein C8J57DRAFT_1463529 [Mycena rebaudengoi]
MDSAQTQPTCSACNKSGEILRCSGCKLRYCCGTSFSSHLQSKQDRSVKSLTGSRTKRTAQTHRSDTTAIENAATDTTTRAALQLVTWDYPETETGWGAAELDEAEHLKRELKPSSEATRRSFTKSTPNALDGRARGDWKLCKETSRLAKDCGLRKQDSANDAAMFGTGGEAGADEDDFHTFKRRRTEVDRDEKNEEKVKHLVDARAGAYSGIVKTFGINVAPPKRWCFFDWRISSVKPRVHFMMLLLLAATTGQRQLNIGLGSRSAVGQVETEHHWMKWQSGHAMHNRRGKYRKRLATTYLARLDDRFLLHVLSSKTIALVKVDHCGAILDERGTDYASTMFATLRAALVQMVKDGSASRGRNQYTPCRFEKDTDALR